MEMFERASRGAYRYNTVVGNITTEDLWSLPLTSKNKANLDDAAKAVNSEINSMQEDSFVTVNANSNKLGILNDKLDILKYIISVRQQENTDVRNAAARAAEKQTLIGILERKQQGELEELSVAELTDKIKALG